MLRFAVVLGIGFEVPRLQAAIQRCLVGWSILNYMQLNEMKKKSNSVIVALEDLQAKNKVRRT